MWCVVQLCSCSTADVPLVFVRQTHDVHECMLLRQSPEVLERLTLKLCLKMLSHKGVSLRSFDTYTWLPCISVSFMIFLLTMASLHIMNVKPAVHRLLKHVRCTYVFHCRLVFANSFNMGAYCMHTSAVYHVFVQECASAYVYMQYVQYICSVQILNLPRYATGNRLHNGTTGCVTGCPVAPLAMRCCLVRQQDANRAARLGNQR